MIAVHELLADFEFQHCRVNFYECRNVVARLIDSIMYVRERKNPLGRRLVNYDLGGCAKKVIGHIFQCTSMRVIITTFYAALCMITVLAKRLCVLSWRFFVSYGRTSLHATLEKIYSL